MTSLAQSIYHTLAFFDAQDMALTLMEVKAYLVKEKRFDLSRPSTIARGPLPTPGEGIKVVDIEQTIDSELKGLIDRQDGFYFLKGREELAVSRKERYKISLRRFRKTKKYLYFLRFIPYLRAVAISGSQALVNSSKASDIDLFVLTKKNRIWLARMLVSFYFQILGQRRHGGFVRSRFCLNHYLDADLSITADRNLYTAVEYASLVPVLGEKKLAEFWRRNQWLGEYLDMPVLERTNQFFGWQWSRWQKVFELLLDFSIGPFLNWLSGIYQKRRIKTQEHILVSDSELSFHPGSRGQRVLEKFNRLTTPVFSANNIVQKN